MGDVIFVVLVILSVYRPLQLAAHVDARSFISILDTYLPKQMTAVVPTGSEALRLDVIQFSVLKESGTRSFAWSTFVHGWNIVDLRILVPFEDFLFSNVRDPHKGPGGDGVGSLVTPSEKVILKVHGPCLLPLIRIRHNAGLGEAEVFDEALHLN